MIELCQRYFTYAARRASAALALAAAGAAGAGARTHVEC